MSHEAERRGASLPLSAGDASAAGVGARCGASPRPWRVSPTDPAVVFDAHGFIVHAEGLTSDEGRARANAALIVAAVNACDPVIRVDVAGADAIERWARALDARGLDAVHVIPPPAGSQNALLEEILPPTTRTCHAPDRHRADCICGTL